MNQDNGQLDKVVVALLKSEIFKIERDNEFAIHKKTTDDKVTEIYNLIKSRVRK